MSLGIRHINILGLGARSGSSTLFFFSLSLSLFSFFPFFLLFSPSPFPRWAISSFFPAKSLLTRFSRPIPPSTLSTLVSLPFTLPLSSSLSLFFYSSIVPLLFISIPFLFFIIISYSFM